MEKFETEHKQEIIAKSMHLSMKRELKIKEMKQIEIDKERELLKEQDKNM